MNDTALRYLNMGRRVTDFAGSKASSFPANSRASQLITSITAAVTALETQSAKQDAADLDGRQATDEKDAARDALVNLLRPINQTARGMEKLFPGIGVRFKMPRGSDQNVINRARAFIEEATPIATEFANRGLPANFLTTLAPAITQMVTTIDRQNTALGAQTAATAALEAAQQQLIDAVREFSPIVRNIFHDDPASIAAWESASHVEKAPKKKKTAPPPPPPPPPAK
jgi:hypothetical protein